MCVHFQKKSEVLDFLEDVREVFRSECDSQVIRVYRTYRPAVIMENLEVFGKYKDKITSFISGMNLSHMRLLKIILIRKLFNNDFFLNHELNLYLFSGSGYVSSGSDLCTILYYVGQIRQIKIKIVDPTDTFFFLGAPRKFLLGNICKER